MKRALTALIPALAAIACGRAERRAGEATDVRVSDAGFQTPESALHDAAGDVYLVSNINGSPVDQDDNGFIAQVDPGGSVRALKWIDGADTAVTLNAPKGMALKGDTLFVADIDALRLFHRATGRPLGTWEVPGAAFLNDVAVGTDGTVYVTDSGLKMGAGGLEPTGTDAIYRFDAEGTPSAVLADPALGAPNGILVEGNVATVVTFGSGEIIEIDLAAASRTGSLPAPPAGQLDGVVRLADGGLLVSSWAGQAVYRWEAGGGYATAVDSVEAPADIGYDSSRGRVLVPLFLSNVLEIRSVR